MAQKISASMPQNMHLDVTFVIEWAALDPTTGAPVSGVTVSNAAMLVSDLVNTNPQALATGPFMLVPGPANA